MEDSDIFSQFIQHRCRACGVLLPKNWLEFPEQEESYLCSCSVRIRPLCGLKVTSWALGIYLFVFGRLSDFDGFTFSQQMVFVLPVLYLTSNILVWVLKTPQIVSDD